MAKSTDPGCHVVVHPCNLSAQEAEVGGSWRAWGQPVLPGLHSEFKTNLGGEKWQSSDQQQNLASLRSGMHTLENNLSMGKKKRDDHWESGRN